MSKTIYITDGDALNIDRVVVSTGDLKGCKVFYSCDLIDEYEARLQADMVAVLEDLDLQIDESAAYNLEVAKVQRLIRDKINALKENKDEKK